MRKGVSGFTIVELLIVIVVIAILAAISVTAYSGIQVRADTSARLSEIMAWKKSFQVYRASEGEWPSAMAANVAYCLGTGFPIGAGGVARCRDYTTTATGYLESNNTAVMNQIETVVEIPNSPKVPHGVTVGPYGSIDSVGTLRITQIFSPKNDDCPNGTSFQYRTTNTLWCDLTLNA